MSNLRSSKYGFGIAVLGSLLTCIFLTGCTGRGEETSKPETEAVTETGSLMEQDGGSAEEISSDNRAEDLPASDNPGRQDSIEDWAMAFCRRDSEVIAAMCDDDVRDSLAERELLLETESGYSFGWSSPWPWDDEKDYEIIEKTDTGAEILYYAWVSDPHVTVWRETVTYRTENGRCIVENEELEMLNGICTGEEYARAYPQGINGTRMDYTVDGTGEVLNENAKREKNSDAYTMLFQPETAAGYLLNFLENPGKVSASVEEKQLEDGSVFVSFAFAEDGSSLVVRMIQPYGEDGIWIPQDYLVNREPGVGQASEI